MQSEAPLKNINVFSTDRKILDMVEVTSTGQIPDGDILSWSQAACEFRGNVDTV